MLSYPLTTSMPTVIPEFQLNKLLSCSNGQGYEYGIVLKLWQTLCCGDILCCGSCTYHWTSITVSMVP